MDAAVVASSISQIKELLPDYGDGFLLACLRVRALQRSPCTHTAHRMRCAGDTPVAAFGEHVIPRHSMSGPAGNAACAMVTSHKLLPRNTVAGIRGSLLFHVMKLVYFMVMQHDVVISFDHLRASAGAGFRRHPGHQPAAGGVVAAVRGVAGPSAAHGGGRAHVSLAAQQLHSRPLSQWYAPQSTVPRCAQHIPSLQCIVATRFHARYQCFDAQTCILSAVSC